MGKGWVHTLCPSRVTGLRRPRQMLHPIRGEGRNKGTGVGSLLALADGVACLT